MNEQALMVTENDTFVDVGMLDVEVDIRSLSQFEKDLVRAAMVAALNDIAETRIHVHGYVHAPVELEDLPDNERALALKHLYGQ